MVSEELLSFSSTGSKGQKVTTEQSSARVTVFIERVDCSSFDSAGMVTKQIVKD